MEDLSKNPIIIREWLGGREIIDLRTVEGYDNFAEYVIQDHEVADELIERFANEKEIVVNEDEPVWIERYTVIDQATADASTLGAL